MSTEQEKSLPSFLGEARLILTCAIQAWQLIPRRFKWTFAGASLLMAGISVCNTFFPLFLGRMVDGLKTGTEQGLAAPEMYEVVGYFLALISLTIIVREVIQIVRLYLVEKACTQLEKTMTVQAISHLIKVNLTAFTQEKIGALQGRLTRSVVGYVRFIRLAFLDFLPPLLTGVFALIATVTMQPLLAIVMVAVIPISVYLTFRQLASQHGVRMELMRSREEMDGTVVEQLGGLEYVRAAATHEHEVKRIEKVAERRRALEVSHLLQMSLYGSAKGLNEAFFHLMVLAAAAALAIQGTVSYGDILTFSFLFANVMAPLNQVHRGLDEGHECSLMVTDLMTMLEEPADPSFTPVDVREPMVASGQPLLVAQNVCVDYSTGAASSKSVLKGVSAVIHHGETIGLAGPSGCGKTTLLRVLLRLVHPTSGNVLIGGVNIGAVSREALGRLVGYVGQNPFVFAGTIADNIRYGRGDVSMEAIVSAATRANIHTEIMALPGGYEAEIAERGSNLSVGQRQRLALARVFLQDPPILILDEGTSALDTISERHIQRAIDLARQDRTVILVAHRLSTLLDADRIYVFSDGLIVETGTYEELYQKGGIFTELIHCTQVGATTRETMPQNLEGKSVS